MLVIVGYLVVIIDRFWWFLLSGGNHMALFQPLELLIIGGAGVGAFVVGSNIKLPEVDGKALGLKSLSVSATTKRCKGI